MNKVALGWADAGIKTVDQAKDDAAAHSQIYYSVMKALGITGRNLVDSEVSLINKWVGEYGFDIELVKAACSKPFQLSRSQASSTQTRYSRTGGKGCTYIKGC